ncbi:MAG: substrate-binding domain-containing protein [bacterium]
MKRKIAIFTGMFLTCLLQLFLTSDTIVQEDKPILLATTTSVQDTGLLEVLVDGFMKKTGLTVKAIAVGTGQALQLGKNGEVDILWVHSPDDEIEFVKNGYGLERTTFMHNDFVVLGPKNDPAKIKGLKTATKVFKRIACANVLFVSRGDNSGTHKKEKKLWQAVGKLPNKKCYIEAGQGMAATLNIANQKLAYCLTDRSTYLTLKKSLDLVVLFEGDKTLFNYYSLILVNPERFKGVNAQGTRKFFDYLLSNETRDIVENFGKDKFGKQIFYWDLSR